MLLSFLFDIKDHRRKEGQRYKLGHILFVSILAILSGSDSYRDIHSFIESNYEKLNQQLQLNWKGLPAYTTIRNIIQGIDKEELENAFRNYTTALLSLENKGCKKIISFDGKVLRNSFDNFKDKKATQILSVFLVNEKIILAHQEIDEKTNEIPVSQKLIEELGISDCIFTFDALHAQKKL